MLYTHNNVHMLSGCLQCLIRMMEAVWTCFESGTSRWCITAYHTQTHTVWFDLSGREVWSVFDCRCIKWQFTRL